MADTRLRQIDLFEMLPEPEVRQAPQARKKPAPSSKQNEGNSRRIPAEEASVPVRERSFKLRYLVIVLVFGAAITAWSWYSSRMTNITQVLVNDHYFTTEGDIIARAGIAVGTHADSINYSQVIRSVEALPYVREARIVQVPPGTILIRVTERRPIGLLKQGNLIRYVDRDGVILPVMDGKALEVPLLHGFALPVAADTLKGISFQAMGAFLEALDRYDIAKITISDVAWQPNTGIVAATGDYGTRLVFGRDDYDSKLRAWQAFYAQVVPKSGLQPFTRIDFRYRGQIVTERM